MTKCCPSKSEIEQLNQLSRIFGTNLQNWNHTSPTDSIITMKRPKK